MGWYSVVVVVVVVVLVVVVTSSGRTPTEHLTFLGKSQNPLSLLVGLKYRPDGQGIRIERVLVHA